jgi:hypothetical protein
MAGEVALPGVGPVPKRTLLIGGGAAVLVMAVLWWRKRNAAGPAAPAAAVDPNALDPNAGDGSGMAGGGGSLTSTGAPGSTTPATNPQWAQAVMQQLDGVLDPQALSAALGVYLTGAAATPEQTLLIDQAIAVEGWPPVSGPNGYPPAIRTQPSTGQTGGGSAPGAVTGLRATEWGATQASFAWAPTTGATSYVISQPNGTPREVRGTEATVGGALGGNVRFPYTFTVKAKNAAGTGPAASITLKTAGGTH